MSAAVGTAFDATRAPARAGRRPRRPLRALVPAGAGVVLGVGVATGDLRLVALGALPLVFAALARPEAALLLFAFVAYLNLPVVAARATGVKPGLTGAVAVLLLAIPFLAHVVIRRRPLVLTPAIGLMTAWLGVLILSAAAAGAAPSTISPIVTFLTEGFILCVLLANAVRTPATLRAVLWALVAAGATMGLISVWQEVTHSYHNTLFGLAQVETLDTHSRAAGGAVRPRLAGPLGEKNSYAQIMIILLPLAFALYTTERDRVRRALAVGCGTLVLCGAALTFSRGGAVAMAIMIVAAVAMRIVPLRHVALIVAAIAAVVLTVAPDYVARVQTLAAAESATSQESSADAAIRGRATENLAALHVLRDHPVLGVGPDQFFRRYSQAYANQLDLRFLQTRRRAHTLYLELAADTGLVGLAAFLAILGTTVVQLRRWARVRLREGHSELAAYANALVLGLVAYLAAGLFLTLAYQRYLWIVIALANSALWMLRRGERAEAR
jgi:putative inorganic carbon (HCO3(-)) transporter